MKSVATFRRCACSAITKVQHIWKCTSSFQRSKLINNPIKKQLPKTTFDDQDEPVAGLLLDVDREPLDGGRGHEAHRRQAARPALGKG